MAISGQITVAAAGTAETGSDVAGPYFGIKAHPDNTDNVFVGNDEGSTPDVTSANGVVLAPTDGAIFWGAVNLNRVIFDAAVSGEKICWWKIPG